MSLLRSADAAAYVAFPSGVACLLDDQDHCGREDDDAHEHAKANARHGKHALGLGLVVGHRQTMPRRPLGQVVQVGPSLGNLKLSNAQANDRHD